MSNNKLYDKNSIESLDPLSFTRLKPGVYAGDTTYSTQLLVEIISNSIDEFRLGHGNKIDVTISENPTVITVRDYAQGFLVNEVREDKKTILEAAFSVLNTSGKYREDGTYEGTSLGSFGIGSKITNFLSHWLKVTTYRDKKFEYIEFKEGVFNKRETGKTTEPSGTFVSWEPSEEFFTHTEVEIKKIISLFQTISCLCSGLSINLDYKGQKQTFFSEKGLDDYVNNNVKDKEIIDNRFHSILNIDEKNKLDFILTYTSDYSSNMTAYVNTGLTERGPHITLLKTFITREFNKFFREKGWLKEKEDNLEGSDIQEGMYVVFNITAPNIAYDAQVKTTVTKIDMKPFTQALSDELHIWLNSNEKDIKMIADKALNARKAREAAKKARDAVREVEKKKEDKKLLNLPSKLVDSYGKKRSDCELLIVEGDSAAGGLVKARNPEIQAIFPIRGKLISAYKNSSEKIFANQEVVNIIKAIGLELDRKTGKLIYNESKLRYGKILLCADGDPDGEAIKNLLLEMFWWLCPELITKGHVYSTTPPLFRITTKKNKYIYLKDQAALEAYKAEHKAESYTVARNKGLGESDSDELRGFLIDEKTRNINQIIVSDEKEANNLMECLMGSSAALRKDYLLKHSEEANIE